MRQISGAERIRRTANHCAFHQSTIFYPLELDSFGQQGINQQKKRLISEVRSLRHWRFLSDIQMWEKNALFILSSIQSLPNYVI